MKYSLIISNTTTKEAYYYHLGEPSESSLYYKFNVSVGEIPDGEYEWILIENPNEFEIKVNYNHPFKSRVKTTPIILVTYTDTLTNGEAVLVLGEGGEERLRFIESGLMRVGDYKEKRLQYDKQTKYTAYDRK